MARPGDVIENPITGERFIFRQTARDTNGMLLEFDLFLKPQGFVAAEHLHVRQEERFEVVSGTVRCRVGGHEQSASAGQVLVVSPGTPHILWNDRDGAAHLLVQFRPALKIETFFETICGLARDGKINKRGMPNLLQGAILAHEYEAFLSWPSIPVQRAGLGVLVPIGRLLGYRARYPQYSGPE